MPTLNVSSNTNYTQAPNDALVNGQNITQVTFSGVGTRIAIFAGSQIGGNSISSTAQIMGRVGLDDNIVINLASAGTVSVAGWTFTDWTQGLTDDRIDVTGSSGNDSIVGASVGGFYRGGGGSDTLVGGNGVDWFGYGSNDVGVAELVNGSGGADVIFADANATVDFSQLVVSHVEELLIGTSASVTMTSDQIGGQFAGRISQLRGDAGTQILIVNTSEVTFTVDLSSLLFAQEPGSPNSLWNSAEDTITINGTGIGDTLTGSSQDDSINGLNGADIIAGGAGVDRLNGDAGNDTINGDAGGDILTGGTGVNTLNGGDGDDYYYVSNATDTLVEAAGAGTGSDNIFTYVNLTMAANIENIFSLGTAGTLTGNTLGNSMIGGYATVTQNLNGGDGNDTLDGSAARDTLIGGEGDDVILGRAGNDSMEGGNGNDSYYVEEALDEVIEAAGGTSGAQDIVYASISGYALTANVEVGFTYGAAANLTGNALANTLLGVYSTAAVTLNGLAGNDVLYGSNFNDTLNGGDNDDTFFGLLGNDSYVGGAGSDTYFLQQAGDSATEAAAQGTDVVYAAFSHTLADHFEVLFIYGAATQGVGNSGDNTLIGSYRPGVSLSLNGVGGNDRVISSTGDDFLAGGAGNDTLTGGGGNDVFYYNNTFGLGIDTITDFTAGAGIGDRINVSGVFASFAAVTAAATEAGGTTTITASAGNQIILAGVTIAQLNADDFVF
jgi:Ca2+-binding RTX toxin-like protein